jgi:hypothetical protein
MFANETLATFDGVMFVSNSDEGASRQYALMRSRGVPPLRADNSQQ